MKVRTLRQARGAWIEWVLALGVGALLVRAGYWFWAYGQLPQPFFYEPSDTFMDWFNTAYWAHGHGAFDTWQTIYPPLSFVLLRVLGIPSCYAAPDGLTARDCDWLGQIAILASYALDWVLIVLTFRRIDRATALPRSFALAAGMPMLFALERGNVLLLCFACMVLAYGPLLRSARARWIFAGLAVNFKVYLITAIAARLLQRRWIWAEGALIATLLIYASTYAILGTGTPVEIFSNITDYSSGFIAAQVLDLWYSVTYQPLISLLQGQTFPVTQLVGSGMQEIGLVVLPAFVHVGQAFIVLAAIATWLRPQAVPPHRAVFLATALALISSEAGGYTQILAILFVFMEPWRGVGRRIAIVLSYILCLPGDILVSSVAPIIRESWLAGRPVEVHYGVGLGMFLRPGILIAIAIALALVTIVEVMKNLCEDGWQSLWRFGRDLPRRPDAFVVDATGGDTLRLLPNEGGGTPRG